MRSRCINRNKLIVQFFFQKNTDVENRYFRDIVPEKIFLLHPFLKISHQSRNDESSDERVDESSQKSDERSE